MPGRGNPNDSCSNDNKELADNDGPCHKPQLDFGFWANAAGGGSTGSSSGYNNEYGYMYDEQWISCISDSEPSMANTDYLVHSLDFIYEIYTPEEDSKSQVLETLTNFERNLSLGVAKSLGLLPCPDSGTQLSVARSGGSWLRRSLTRKEEDQSRFLGDANVLAVSMMPKDEIDSASVCTTADKVKTDVPSACSPIKGGMTFYIEKSNGVSIPKDEDFFNAVESYIKDDTSTYLEDGLLHVEYVGEAGSSTLTKMGGSVDNNTTSSTGEYVGIALAGVILVLVGVGGAWFYRKKRTRNQIVEEDVHDKIIIEEVSDHDIQQGATEELSSYADTSTAESPPIPSDSKNVEADSLDSKTAEMKLNKEITDDELDRWIRTNTSTISSGGSSNV